MTNEQLVEEIQAGIRAKENLESLYANNEGFIVKIASKYAGYSEMEDLKQQGFIGLYEAATRYSKDYGSSFINYASFWLIQFMQSYVYNCCRSIRLPAGRSELIRKYKALCKESIKNCNKYPSNDEVCEELDINIETLDNLRIEMYMLEVDSMDRNLTEDGMTYSDIIQDNNDVFNNITNQIGNEALNSELWSAVDSLERNQSNTLHRYYENGQTIQSIAGDSGLTVWNVRSAKDKALSNLRRKADVKRIAREYNIITGTAFRKGRLSEFKTTWTSSTEYAAMKL